MRKTKHFFLALLAVTGLSTAWASGLPGSDPDNNPAKTTYTVQWTGATEVVYDGQSHGLTATYVDGGGSHTLSLTYSNGTTVLTTAPKNAGAWTVTVSVPSGVSLDNTTTMLNIQQAPVYVTGAAAEIAKFADGTVIGVVTDHGVLNGVLNNDDVTNITTAVFDNALLGTGKTISLYYALVGDLDKVGNYALTKDTTTYTHSGVIIPNIVPNYSYGQNGFDISANGYCSGSNNYINYSLTSGNPDQYSVDFDSPLISDINWTNLPTAGLNGTININLPALDLPSGDYTLSVYFRDSRYPALISAPVPLTIHMNLPSSYTMPLFDNVIALIDTCNCFSDVQWYHSTDGGNTWTAIDGANGYFYREEGGLTGQYYVSVKMNGVQTFTCPQTDMETLVSDNNQNALVNAYPNPTVDNVTITIEGSENIVHTFRVISTLGVEMARGAFEGESFTIDMQGYQHGNYMVNVDGNVIRVIKN